MLKKINKNRTALKTQWHDQFADFKQNVRSGWDKNFPKKNMELDTSKRDHQPPKRDENLLSRHNIIYFRIAGLVVAALGYFLYNTLSYVFMLIAAFIISLAIEGVVTFRQRLTRSRGIWILIAYFLVILFLLSGFFIIVPFCLNRGTQVLEYMISGLKTIQLEILSKGFEGYLDTIAWLPGFAKDWLLERVSGSNSADYLQTITANLGNIVNMSSMYLKTIGEYAMNIFGGIFSAAGKVVILITLAVFFSFSHYEVKYRLKYLFRRTQQSKEKIDHVYGGIASRLRSQLLLCLFIGVFTYFGLRVLHRCGIPIPQKEVLALLAGLFEIIPYLGPLLGALLPMLFALFMFGFPEALAVVLAFTIIQQFEEKFLVPVLMSKTLGVNPLLVFVSMLFGGIIMGMYGFLLAVPISVILSIIFSIPEPKNIPWLSLWEEGHSEAEEVANKKTPAPKFSSSKASQSLKKSTSKPTTKRVVKKTK